jgi:flagellar biosynthesis/type III secretory pathway protein FliH
MTLAEQFRKEGREKGMMEGLEKGMMEGLEKGEVKALVNTVIKLLTKKFGTLPEELKAEISKLDTITLEVIIGDILEYQSLEDVRKYVQ